MNELNDWLASKMFGDPTELLARMQAKTRALRAWETALAVAGVRRPPNPPSTKEFDLKNATTLFVLRWLVRPLVSFSTRLGWFASCWADAAMYDVFDTPESEIESKHPLWLVRWMYRACRLEQAASAPRVPGKRRPKL